MLLLSGGRARAHTKGPPPCRSRAVRRFVYFAQSNACQLSKVDSIYESSSSNKQHIAPTLSSTGCFPLLSHSFFPFRGNSKLWTRRESKTGTAVVDGRACVCCVTRGMHVRLISHLMPAALRVPQFKIAKQKQRKLTLLGDQRKNQPLACTLFSSPSDRRRAGWYWVVLGDDDYTETIKQQTAKTLFSLLSHSTTAADGASS